MSNLKINKQSLENIKNKDKENNIIYDTLNSAIDKLQSLKDSQPGKDEKISPMVLVMTNEKFKKVFGFSPNQRFKKFLFYIKCFFSEIKERIEKWQK